MHFLAKYCGTKNCITDNNDYACPVSFLKTFGFGGAGGKIATPDGAVGLCNAEAATCSEYIDPISSYVNNLVIDPTAETVGKNGAEEKWIVSTTASGYYTQRISVQPNKLYVLQSNVPVIKPIILDKFATSKAGTGGQARILGATSTNELSDSVLTITSTSSVVFNTGPNTYLSVSRFGTTTPTTVDKISVSIKEAIINYQLSSNLDTKTCNGVVNPDGGCVLFNTRTQSGNIGLKALTFDAYATSNGAPKACTGNNCSANSIIKVSPDRVCSRWLDCQTFIEDPITHEKVCYGVGECDQLNDKNECGNYLDLGASTVRDIKNSQNQNATGYSLLNNYYLGEMKEVGQNTEAHFDFESNSSNLSCLRNIDTAGNPVLDDKDQKNRPCTFNRSINDSLVLEPNRSATSYPAHGKGYLAVLNYYQISPLSNNSSISIYTNQDYYINYLVNTKGSSAKAKVVITDQDGVTLTIFVEKMSDNWERKVHRFRVNSASPTTKQIKIYLTSDTQTINDGYVYFDDINIEPVLQVGANNYVSKDCRLYPSDDSLSCLSANNNVIKDGLYGYCLQYDSLNPSVCLMWYPIDQIAPITRNSQSTLGYSGKFPLYYCTEANGNFDLVEKRKPFYIKSDSAYSGDNAGYNNNHSNYCDYSLLHKEQISYKVNGNIPDNGFSKDNSGIFNICDNDYVGFIYHYSYNDPSDGGKGRCNVDYWCVPKEDKISVTMEMRSNNAGFDSRNAYVVVNGSKYASYTLGKMVLPTGENYSEGATRNDKNNNELQARINVVNGGGWYKYNGLDIANNKEG